MFVENMTFYREEPGKYLLRGTLRWRFKEDRTLCLLFVNFGEFQLSYIFEI
jgi:hypothetical protein